MRTKNSVEIVAGLFMLLGIAALVVLASQATDMGSALRSDSFRVQARFANIGDLAPRAPVTIGGVTVGSVEEIGLDPQTFEALVTLRIAETFNDIPNDTSASILTSGVLGDQYIGLEPGGSPDPLQEGDEIFITQSAVVLEQLISKYMFNTQNDSDEENEE